MHAHIIYFNFLKPNGDGISIGGIQTYVSNLIPVLKNCGYEVTIYQRSDNDFHKKLNGYDVYGVGQKKNLCPEVADALLDKALSTIDHANDLLIYGCETCITRKVSCRTIAIQHGILWDIPFKACSSLRYFKHFIGKCNMAWRINQRVNKVDQLVCVDYNFVNWHRAITPYTKTNHIVIPNFAAIPPAMPSKDNDVVNIIFARRFFVHRGTRLFANVAKRLLAKHLGICITIAGSGPDEEYLHKVLGQFTNVHFITYASTDSLKIHENKDIAVIPTLGSEGTSLSLLEAMASGCAVVCTNVGGMTNIVLDGYNGLMINPDEVSLYAALEMLIENSTQRAILQNNAYITAKYAFSLTAWKEKWVKVINS